MHTLAALLRNRRFAWGVVLASVLATAILGRRALRVENDDNLLAFLPRDNQDVRTFYDINTRFGGIDVALIGIATDDVFTYDFLDKLHRCSRELSRLPGLSNALTLANVTDFAADEVNGGIVVSPLIPEVPRDAAGLQALRDKVFSRDHLVGNLISADGKAVLLYAFLANGTDPRSASGRIREVVERHFPGAAIAWGGNPFIASYVYDTVQSDLARLTPWAVAVIVLLMLVSLRAVYGTLLALASTAMAIAVTMGLMSIFDVRLNLMLGSMPIVVFAIGCAYAIHILTRYYDWREKVDARTALHRTLLGVGPVVLIAGTTAAAAILSYVVMDIEPIRQFGVFTALGIFTTMLFALTFVPAAISLAQLPPRLGGGPGPLRRAMVHLAVFVAGHRRAVGVGLVLTTAAGVYFTTRIRTGVDQTSFFAEGSPPAQADRFLREHFGAAQFLQVKIAGDMTQPAVLRAVQALADRLEALPHVTSVVHVGRVIATLNEAMSGERRIPDTVEQVQSLYSFTRGDPSAAQLVTEDRTQALLQVKVDTNQADELTEVLEAVQGVVDGEGLATYELALRGGPRGNEVRARLLSDLGARLGRIAGGPGVALPPDVPARLQAFASTPAPAVAPEAIVERVAAFLRSSECAVTLPAGDPDPALAVARAVVALGEQADPDALTAAVQQALGASASASDADFVADLEMSLETPLADSYVRERARMRAEALAAALDLKVPEGRRGERLREDLAMAWLSSEATSALLPPQPGSGAPTAELAIATNGLPVLHRGLAHSVRTNQIKSLALALLLVVAILSVMFRSLRVGLMAASPTVFTLLVIHGLMGALRIPLDIGTSLLGSLILANGVDYGVHLIASWHADGRGAIGARDAVAHAAACAADRSGPAIWTTGLTMFVGFFVLALGDAKPLQVVVSLKAAAMLMGALATFLVIPVLARRASYASRPQAAENVEPSAAVSAALAQHRETSPATR